jgi:hypothetical protein
MLHKYISRLYRKLLYYYLHFITCFDRRLPLFAFICEEVTSINALKPFPSSSMAYSGTDVPFLLGFHITNRVCLCFLRLNLKF